MAKILVCRCEDVTLADLEHALSQGYFDIEEIKRVTGLGTGPCGGKECLVPTCRLLGRERAARLAAGTLPPEASRVEHPFTVRPPMYAVQLGTLAAAPGPETKRSTGEH